VSLCLLQVLTPLHVGEGAQVGAVDLPVARERHSAWPFVPGASLKGALRAFARYQGVLAEDIRNVFGSEPHESLSRGATQFGDGILLALPARTFARTFALLASPLSLARFAQQVTDAPPIPTPDSAEWLLVGKGFDLIVSGKEAAIVEDLCFLQKHDEQVDAWAAFLRQRWLGEESPLKHLTIVHDDVFAHAAHAWLPTRTRNAIDQATGVVDDKKLFGVEYLAPETLLGTIMDGEHRAIPLSGEAFPRGGHNSTGSGRVTLWREKP